MPQENKFQKTRRRERKERIKWERGYEKKGEEEEEKGGRREERSVDVLHIKRYDTSACKFSKTINCYHD